MDFTLFAFLAVALALPVFGIADAIRRPERAFYRIGRRKWVWVAIQVVVPVMGSLAYYAWVRPRVRASEYWDRR